MARRMPVLGQHDVTKPRRQTIDDRHDLVAPRHRQGAARTKIVLDVDHDEDVVVAERRVSVAS